MPYFSALVSKSFICILPHHLSNILFYSALLVQDLHFLWVAKGISVIENRTLSGGFMNTLERTRETFRELRDAPMQKSILIVDDEEDLTWSISKTLARHDKDFAVRCAHNGDEAMEILARQPFDVVISDIRMPGRDGLQLLHEINNRFPRTKVIIMTAYGSHETRTQIAAKGGTFYLEKPFEIRSLRKLIYEALDMAPPKRSEFSELDRPDASASESLDEGFFLKEKRDSCRGNLNAVMLLA